MTGDTTHDGDAARPTADELAREHARVPATDAVTPVPDTAPPPTADERRLPPHPLPPNTPTNTPPKASPLTPPTE